MNFQYLHRYPFIRLLFPLIAGFLVGNGLFFRGVYVSKGVLVGGLAGLFLLLLVVYFSHRYSLRWMFGCILYLFVFLGGAGGINQALQQTLYSFSEQKCVYRAVVSEQTEPKEHSFLCRAFLEERQDSVCTMPVNRKVLLYISKDSLSEGLRSGDELIFLPMYLHLQIMVIPMNLIMRVICATKGLAGLLLLQVGIGKLPDIGFPDHAGRLHWNTGSGFLTNIVL